MKKSRSTKKRGTKPFTHIAVVLFAVIAVLHVFRLLQGWEVILAGWVAPMWISVLGLVVTGGLALMVWREMRH
jgi:hypothetical protein